MFNPFDLQKVKQVATGVFTKAKNTVLAIGKKENELLAKGAKNVTNFLLDTGKTVNTTREKIGKTLMPNSAKEGIAQGMVPVKKKDGSTSYIDFTGAATIGNVGKPIAKKAVAT